MQQRIAVKHFSNFKEAHEAKINLLIEFPDNNYQIRKTSNTFKLVRRFKINELLAKEVLSGKKRSAKRRSRPHRPSQVL